VSEWLERVKAQRNALHPRELWHAKWPTLAADLDQLIQDADNWFAYLRWRAKFDREVCCDLHSMRCEPPSELCCDDCPEVDHPSHRPGVQCVLDRSGTAPR
jgi:hypothetical protein